MTNNIWNDFSPIYQKRKGQEQTNIVRIAEAAKKILLENLYQILQLPDMTMFTELHTLQQSMMPVVKVFPDDPVMIIA